MKLSAKPISSPGRTEKFPPPLMRFLRSNVGSRSRGRSRSSPMFVRKKNPAIETTQEPSSPKVTCMGQVRVRRSSKQAAAAAKRGRPSSAAAARDRAPTRCRCRWIRNAMFCHHEKTKPDPCHCHCQPVWPKWGFFQVGKFRRKPNKLREDSSKSGLNFRGRFDDESEHEEDDESECEERVVNGDGALVFNSCTPPRNALLLTRCRSAPYRSSSLAGRFWGSPLRNEDTVEEQSTEPENREATENKKPSSQRESISDEKERNEPNMERKMRFFKEIDDSLRERITKSENVLEFKFRGMQRGGGDPVSAGPLGLTRCKSEPARTAHKLDPVVNNFWKKRRLGFADTFSPLDL